MKQTVRVYVNGNPVDIPEDATVLDAVRAYSVPDAQGVAMGWRALSDSRGLPIDAAEPIYGGAIVRVTRGR